MTVMLSKNRSFFYLIQDIAGEESSECATRKRKAQSVSAITCWRKLSNSSVAERMKCWRLEPLKKPNESAHADDLEATSFGE